MFPHLIETQQYSIFRGVFQGDPLFPLLFNAINPLFVFLSKSEHCGYSAQLIVLHSTDYLHLVFLFMLFWSDSSSDSLAGLYRANVTFYHCDGSCSLHYDNGDIEPSVNLHTIEWCFVGHYCKNFQVD